MFTAARSRETVCGASSGASLSSGWDKEAWER